MDFLYNDIADQEHIASSLFDCYKSIICVCDRKCQSNQSVFSVLLHKKEERNGKKIPVVIKPNRFLFLTKRIPTIVNPNIESSLTNFTMRVMSDDDENLFQLWQSILGTCLISESYKKMFIVRSQGNTLKSTFANLIKNMLGDNAGPLSSGSITKTIRTRKTHTSGPQPELCGALILKTATLVSELNTTSDVVLDDNLIKLITGESKISLRNLYERCRETSMQSTIIAATNDSNLYVQSSDDLVALKKRIIWIETNNNLNYFLGPQPDGSTIDKPNDEARSLALIDHESAQSLLNFAINGLRKHLLNGSHTFDEVNLPDRVKSSSFDNLPIVPVDSKSKSKLSYKMPPELDNDNVRDLINSSFEFDKESNCRMKKKVETAQRYLFIRESLFLTEICGIDHKMNGGLLKPLSALLVEMGVIYYHCPNKKSKIYKVNADTANKLKLQQSTSILNKTSKAIKRSKSESVTTDINSKTDSQVKRTKVK